MEVYAHMSIPVSMHRSKVRSRALMHDGIDRSLTLLQQGQVHEALKLWHQELCVKDFSMAPSSSRQTQVSHHDSTTCAAAMQAKVQVRCLKVALG